MENKMVTEKSALLRISEECIHCKACVRNCAFLKEAGDPGDQAKAWLAGDNRPLRAGFSCNLCSLCSAVCPKELPISEMFLELRREAVRTGVGEFREHRPLLFYERAGRSKLLRLQPTQPCETLFFPGCSLPGLLPQHLQALVATLAQQYASFGVMLDCCSKPSHDLGREAAFAAASNDLMQRISALGVKRLLTVCPNCYKVFSRLAKQNEAFSPQVVMLWGELEAKETPGLQGARLALHDPCPLRFETQIQQDVRQLIAGLGVEVVELKQNRATTLCCGEGGGVPMLEPQYAEEWRQRRARDCEERMEDSRLITWCAGCVFCLQRLPKVKPQHLLTLLYPQLPVPPIPGSLRRYWNRLRLKWTLRRR